MMLGETSDMSQFFKLEWFKWVRFQEKNTPLLDDMPKLGHCFVPSMDIDPAMTTKIHMQNGQVLHRSMHRQLIPDEIADKDGSEV